METTASGRNDTTKPSVDPFVIATGARGSIFTVNDEPYRRYYATGFMLPARMEHGENVRPQLRQIKAAGGDGVRVLTMAKWIRENEGLSHLPPIISPSTIRPFTQIAREEGIAVEWCLNADGQYLLQTPARVREQTERYLNELRDLEAYVALANEPFKNLPEGMTVYDLVDLARASGVRWWTTGDYDVCNKRTWTSGTYGEYHGKREETDVVEAGKEPQNFVHGFKGDGTSVDCDYFVGWDGPWCHGEPIGFALQTIRGKRTNSLITAEDIGAGFATGCAGICAHSTSGVKGELLNDVEEACMRVYFAAAKRIPADVPLGKWAHDGEDAHPLFPDGTGDRKFVSECVSRWMENGDIWVVATGVKDGWVPPLRPGRSIVRVLNPQRATPSQFLVR